MRKAVIGFAAVLVVALTATVASAGNAHLKVRTPSRSPTMASR